MGEDVRSRKAKSTGASKARRLVQARRAALRRRKASLDEVPAEVATSQARAQQAAAARLRAVGGPRSRGTLVAEGDSWFDYPGADVLGLLEDEHGYDVDSVANAGDRAENMAYSDGQLDAFMRLIERLLRRNLPPKAILFSGGGNDIAGDPFAMLLNHIDSPSPGLNAAIVEGVIDQRIRDSYVTILSKITETCKQYMGRTIPILTHGYGYAVPDGRGFLGGWWLLPGPWLEPGFRLKGYGDKKMALRKQIVSALIDHFNAMVKGVAQLPGFSHVVYVDLRPALPSGSNYKDWWADELHPTSGGFSKVADEFAKALAKITS